MPLSKWVFVEECTVLSTECLADPESNTTTLEVCNSCPLPNCNGRRHERDVEFIYPTCADCGIELLDLLELLEEATLLSTDSCEVCQLPYESDALAKVHFYSHFYMSDENLETQFICMECSDQVIVDHHSDVKLEIIDVVEDTYLEGTSDGVEHSGNFDDYEEEVVENPFEDFDINPIVQKRTRKIQSFDGSPPRQRVFLEKVVDHFECSTCAEIFYTKLELNLHRRQYHSIAKFDTNNMLQCRMCYDMFTEKKQRQEHEIEQHRNAKTLQFDCPECSVSRSTASALHNHMQAHSNAKPFVCDVCGKSFRRINNLDEHCKTHASDRIHKCQQCPKSFKTVSLRNRHVRLAHCETRPYICDQCPKRYKDFSDLRRHRWTHGGYEKRFECDECGKTFFENKTLRNHKKVHSKQKEKTKPTTKTK